MAVRSCSWKKCVIVEIERGEMVGLSVLTRLVGWRDIVVSLLRVVGEMSVNSDCVILRIALRERSQK